MSESQEILTKINWFLEPISNFILFLFTTKGGFILLLFSLFAYLILPVFDELKMRRVAYRAASSYTGSRIPFLEKFYVIGKIIGGRSAGIIAKAPVLLISLLLMMMVVTISKSISTVNEFVDNRNKIEELKTVVKQLDKRYKVADIFINNYDFVKNETTMTVNFDEGSITSDSLKSQKITIKGSDIFFDAIVMNFEFSKIIEGGVRNLVLPYRIFSNSVPASEGILLQYKDKNGVPIFFKRADNEIYGLTTESYNSRIAEFSEYLTDEDKAREAGIRSTIGNAVHKKIRKGEKMEIWVEQTGGIVIKQTDEF